MSPPDVRLVDRPGDGPPRATLLWRPATAHRMISTAVDGGGIGERSWWLNAQVGLEYHHGDPAAHVREMAASLGLPDAGVGMLTAADVRFWVGTDDEGVGVAATVGLGLPVFAAAARDRIDAETLPRVFRPGTINVLVTVPVALSDAALVNAVITATEAKTQALVEAGVPGTGTSSDALCVACPAHGTAEPYGGPRSTWGARIARAVHSAVTAGTAGWRGRHAVDW